MFTFSRSHHLLVYSQDVLGRFQTPVQRCSCSFSLMHTAAAHWCSVRRISSHIELWATVDERTSVYRFVSQHSSYFDLSGCSSQRFSAQHINEFRLLLRRVRAKAYRSFSVSLPFPMAVLFLTRIALICLRSTMQTQFATYVYLVVCLLALLARTSLCLYLLCSAISRWRSAKKINFSHHHLRIKLNLLTAFPRN